MGHNFNLQTIKSQVKLILKTVLEVNVNADASVQNIHSWDSLNYLVIVASLEKEFNIEFDPDELIELNSFQNIVSILSRKLS